MSNSADAVCRIGINGGTPSYRLRRRLWPMAQAHGYQRLAAFGGAYGQWLMAHGYQRLAAFGGAYG